MAPDRQRAHAAAATATAVTNMHDVVVQKAHDLDVTRGQEAPTSEFATAKPEITRRDVHTASSIDAQRRYNKANPKEANLAHQAALGLSAVKARDSSQTIPPGSSSAASSKPVLVRAPSIKTDMKKRAKTRVGAESPLLPPLESFSIHDILTSIGPEAEASIDAIAEICGRSKMSLADEHSSHRPPHVQLVTSEGSPAESLPSTRLEPVVEATSVESHTRSKTRSLNLARAFPDIGNATAATSNVTSQAQAKVTQPTRDDTSAETAPAPLLLQVFAWLRRSTPGKEAASTSNKDTTVENTLRSMLSDTDSIRS